MTDRQAEILLLLVKEYIRTAQPVSSKFLVEKCKLDLSSATVRHELNVLEKEDYLYSPHTSAGRVPTDRAYRIFVDMVQPESDLTQEEQRNLQVSLLKEKIKSRKLSRTLTKLLSQFSGDLIISRSDDGEDQVFESGMANLLSQPEFQDQEEVVKMAEFLDYLDERLESVQSKNSREVQVFIGGENPVVESDNFSMLVTRVNFPEGKKGLLAIIGPKRMRYHRNIDLLNFIKDIFN